MLKGLHLTLLIGPVIPIPVPQVVTDALESVTVENTEDSSSFELSFRVGKRSPLQTVFLLTGGVPLPLRVVLIATMNGLPQVLVDGLITNHQIKPGGDGNDSILTLIGNDLTAAMALQEFTGIPYAAMTVELQVELILAKYAILGIIPMVIPTPFPDVPLPLERIPIHHGHDLDHIQERARWVGYTFHMLSPAPLVNIAYWGPKMRIGLPQSAVNIDMDAYSNVESLSFGFENRDRVQPILQMQIPETTRWIPVPLPDVSLLNPPFGLVEPLPSQITFLSDVGRAVGLGQRVGINGLYDRGRHPGCAALRRHPAGSVRRRRARCRHRFRRALLCQQGHASHQARRIQAIVSSDPQRTDFHDSGGAAMTAKRYFGKHRGSVINNVDPMFRGRIQAQVPAVSSLLPSTWCEPCLPVAGIQSGAYFVPLIGAGVWIEFEQGDPARPIWTGCFWGSAAEVPPLAVAGVPASPSIVLQTAGQTTMSLSDLPGGPPGGVLLKTLTSTVSITDTGIILQNGAAMISMLAGGAITISNGAGATITMGPGPVVAINGEALVVT